MPEQQLPRHDATKTGQPDACDAFATFREGLRVALTRVHTPELSPPPILYEVSGCDPASGPASLQTCLLAAIAELEPDGAAPSGSRLRRAFSSLHHRYVLGLTQEETAECLSVSVRHLQRIQRDAVHLLARHLWERRPAAGDGNAGHAKGGLGGDGAQATDWRSQATRELEMLSTGEPDQAADVESTVRGIIELERQVMQGRGIVLRVGAISPELIAAIHPMALRQALVVAIGRLSQHMSTGTVVITSYPDRRFIQLSLEADQAAIRSLDEEQLVADIILPPGSSVSVRRALGRTAISLRLPKLERHSVVVVEDNEDMVVFYRHCTAASPYRILHEAPGTDLVARIEANDPDVVVLDVMMPHMDGWQVLTHLRALPSTRATPVVVCSVVKEESLALALGAAGFLSKPVLPRRFLEELDRVLRPTS